MESDLNIGMLYQVMVRLGERRNKNWGFTSGAELLDLMPPTAQSSSESDVLFNLDRHVSFLEGLGYVEVESRFIGGAIGGIRLTAMGQCFVQPELAEFGKEPLLPRVVQSIEAQILTYPEESKNTFLFRLRESIAQNSPELVAKLLVDVLPRLLSQGG